MRRAPFIGATAACAAAVLIVNLTAWLAGGWTCIGATEDNSPKPTPHLCEPGHPWGLLRSIVILGPLVAVLAVGTWAIHRRRVMPLLAITAAAFAWDAVFVFVIVPS